MNRKPLDPYILTESSNLPEPEQFWRTQADEPQTSMAEKAACQNGFVLLSPIRRKRDLGAAVANGDRM